MNRVKQPNYAFFGVRSLFWNVRNRAWMLFGRTTLSNTIRGLSSIRMAGMASSVALAAIVFAIFVPFVYHIDGTEAATGTAQESTLNLAITNATATVDLVVSNAGGTFATSASGKEASFSVTTNNYSGYTLSISAADDAGTLVNGTDSLASIGSSLTQANFDASANNGKWGYKPNKYRSGNTTVDNTGDNAVYLVSPTTESTTLDVTTSPNNNANSYTIALGARADYTKPNGNYSKTFVLTAVGNKINYTVTYDKNTTDTVTNLPSVQSGDTNGTSITLVSTYPSRDHYSFLGWCSVATTTTNGVDSCSGTTYNPNGAGTNLSYGIDQTTVNNATLYAMWKIDTFTCTKQYRLQNADGTYPSGYTTDGSETINYGDTCTYSKTVTDYQTTSDSVTMTEAKTISLDLPRNTYALTVNKNDSYISSVTGAGTYRWGQSVAISATVSSGNEFTTWSQTSGTASSFASAASASTTFTMPKSAATIYADGKSSKLYLQNMTAEQCTTTAQTVYDSRDEEPYLVQKLADNKCWLLDNLRLDITDSTVLNSLTISNTNANAAALTSLKSGNRSVGAQYATAGISGNWTSGYEFSVPMAASSGCYYDSNWVEVCEPPFTKDMTTTSYGAGSGKIGVYYNYCAASAGSYCYDEDEGTGNASYDICPAGWGMPTGGSSGEYKALYAAYSSDDTNFRAALSTPLSGYFVDGSANDQGSYGSFWSSTWDDSNLMYTLYVDSSSVDPQSYDDRNIGYSVRCVLQ